MKSVLEPSSGATIQDPNEQQMQEILGKIGSEVDTCNFTYGDSYLGVYGSSRNEIYLTYTDESNRELTSSKGLSTEEVTPILLACQQGNEDWKTTVPFEEAQYGEAVYPEGTTAEAGNPPSTNSPTRGIPRGKQNLKDSIVSGIKHQASREVSRGVSRGVGRIIGQIIRSILKGRR